MTVEVRHSRFLDGNQLTRCYETYLQYVDASEEGHVRGFYRGIPRIRLPEDVVRDDVVKFTIDSRQDAWVHRLQWQAFAYRMESPRRRYVSS